MKRAAFRFRERHAETWSFHQRSSNVPHAVGNPGPPPASAFKEYLHKPLIALPTPRAPRAPLHAALRGRRSCRAFGDAPLPLRTLSTLLKHSYGVSARSTVGTEESLARPLASAGALYPLELYVIARNVRQLDPGIYHYAPVPHALELLAARAMPRTFGAGLFVGPPVDGAACVIVLSAVPARTCFKYGARGYRYLLIEVGEAAQSLALLAAALNLGCLNVGGFFEAPMGRLLELDPDEELPLLCVALGNKSPRGRERRDAGR